MNFKDLHELLRLELLRRIAEGDLTGTDLARQVGFRQAHVSNFLNQRRSLSLAGLDRVLAAQSLTVDQLMPLDLSASSAQVVTADELVPVPVVSPSTAMNAGAVRPEQVIETLHLQASGLLDSRLPASSVAVCGQRFVAIRADAQQAAAMDPMIAPGARVVIDRSDLSLAPNRPLQRAVHAVRSGSSLLLRFVEFSGESLILRPLSLDFPVQLVSLGARQSPAEYLVGRVCLVVSEL